MVIHQSIHFIACIVVHREQTTPNAHQQQLKSISAVIPRNYNVSQTIVAMHNGTAGQYHAIRIQLDSIIIAPYWRTQSKVNLYSTDKLSKNKTTNERVATRRAINAVFKNIVFPQFSPTSQSNRSNRRHTIEGLLSLTVQRAACET